MSSSTGGQSASLQQLLTHRNYWLQDSYCVLLCVDELMQTTNIHNIYIYIVNVFSVLASMSQQKGKSKP